MKICPGHYIVGYRYSSLQKPFPGPVTDLKKYPGNLHISFVCSVLFGNLRVVSKPFRHEKATKPASRKLNG